MNVYEAKNKVAYSEYKCSWVQMITFIGAGSQLDHMIDNAMRLYGNRMYSDGVFESSKIAKENCPDRDIHIKILELNGTI